MLQCHKCNRTYGNKQSLKYHIEVEHEGRVFSCPLCHVTIKHYANLWFHKKQVHGFEEISCNECDFKTKTKRQLVVHVGLRHGSKDFKCQFCDFKAGYQHRINKHVRNKHGSTMNDTERKLWKIHKCNSCNYYESLSKVNEHMKHCNKKIVQYPFPCTKCSLKFEFERARNLHIETKHSEYYEEDDKNYISKVEIVDSSEITPEKVGAGIKPESIHKRLLCPIGFCTFSVNANDESNQRNHIQDKHKETNFDEVKFLSL